MTERYLRHNLIDWFDQELLKTMRVLVVGAGAVGNEVIKNLALLGVGAIRIVDFDNIEVHNLTRSVLFSETDVGKSKAEVAADAARRLDPNCEVESLVGDFWEQVSFAQLQEASVVFCCVDNFGARFRINQLCSLLGVDLINSGIDSRFVSGEIYPFGRDPDSACFECNLPPSVYQRVAERYSCGWLRRVAFEEKKVPTTAITASYAGALATSLFLYSYRDDAQEGARRVFLDTIASNTSKVSFSRNPGCPCCGTLSSKRIIVKARRTIAAAIAWNNSWGEDARLSVSDPILVSWETPNCVSCASTPSQVIFELASRFNDSAVTCQKCGLKQRMAVIRDQFTIQELVERFAGKELPGKFAMFQDNDTQVVVELQQ